MKYLKKYENFDYSDLLGKYVVINHEFLSFNTKLENFIKSNIGQIVKITKNNPIITVGYDNVPEDLEELFNFHISNTYTMTFNKNQIIGISDNKKDIEYLIDSNKYNI